MIFISIEILLLCNKILVFNLVLFYYKKINFILLYEFFYILLIKCLSFVVLYYFNTLPHVSLDGGWSSESGVTLEWATKFFKAYKRKLRNIVNECKVVNFYTDMFIWREVKLEEECEKEEEKYMPSD